MLEQILFQVIPDYKSIESRTHAVLKKYAPECLSLDRICPNREDRLWNPLLCFLAAEMAGKTTIRTGQIASILHMLYMATCLHRKIPEESEASEREKEICYPVLLGDLLYSQVYADVFLYGIETCLLKIASLIGDIHKLLAEPNGRKLLVQEAGIESMMGETACCLGAYSASGQIRETSLYGELGWLLGIIKFYAISNRESGKTMSFLDEWNEAWDILNAMRPGKAKEMISEFLEFAGKERGLRKPEYRTIIGQY